MTEKILFVDDEENVLQSMKRQLRKRFSMQTAMSGDEALKILKEEGPFAVIVSDMRMPGMNGVELLSRVKELYPEIVRIMLTGNADQETAMEAVNAGQIFRFLTKPCSTAILVPSLALAQRQYKLITAEKELLQKTLRGSVTVLSELLSQANPTVFSAGLRIKEYACDVARQLELTDLWKIEVASLLSQIGCTSLPTDIINKKYAGIALDDTEQEMWEKYPEIGARLLEQIPRLESVTKMIRWQQKKYSHFTEEDTIAEFEEVLTGAQILKAVIDFDILQHQGMDSSQAMKQLRRKGDDYNPDIIKALANFRFQKHVCTLSLTVGEITVGMIAEEDIVAKNGAMILPAGQEISWSVLQALHNFNNQVGIVEPITVHTGLNNEEQDSGKDET